MKNVIRCSQQLTAPMRLVLGAALLLAALVPSSAQAEAGSPGIEIGMNKDYLTKARRVSCEKPRAGGQRCTVKPVKQEKLVEVLLSKDRVIQVRIEYKPSWTQDYDAFVADYIDALGPPTKTSSFVVPFGPKQGHQMRTANWSEKQPQTTMITCTREKAGSDCGAFSVLIIDRDQIGAAEEIQNAYAR